MRYFITYIIAFSVLVFAACEKAEPTEEPFFSNAFALQNDSNQQFLYVLERLPSDSLWLHFEAYTKAKPVPGVIDFYVLFTDTMDTLWLDSTASYWCTVDDIIGDKYNLDTTANNYVVIQYNSNVYDLSLGIFQAKFLIDTALAPKIDTLSPDTMRLENGSFSGSYFE